MTKQKNKNLKVMNNCFFSRIKYFDSLDSTNNELLNNEYDDKTLIYTYNQTKGRGRFNRKWITFKDKALALSFLLKSESNDHSYKNLINNYFLMNMILSISLIDLLNKKYDINSWIKWPNDIYINDKKLAGILTETDFINKDNFKIVGGIGININAEEKEILNINKKATSLSLEKKEKINLKEFTNLFIEELSNNFFSLFSYENHNISNEKYIIKAMGRDINILDQNQNNKQKLNEVEVAKIKNKWLDYCNIIGKHVVISNTSKDFDGVLIKGKVLDIDNQGFLIVETENKKMKILSGDVSVVVDQ